MKTIRNVKIFGTSLLAAGFIVALSSAGFATEPVNNNYPWKPNGAVQAQFGDVQIASYWSGLGAAVSTGHGITAGDTDYIMYMCGGWREVPEVQINFTDSAGDLDMMAYRTDGTFLGSGTSVTNNENINVSAHNQDAVVVRVYGYSGATNSYVVAISCD